MTHRYSIGFISILFVLMILIGGANLWEFERVREKAEQEKIIKSEENSDKESVRAADGQATKAECFYLSEDQGYIIVLKSDRKTVYEYTNIPVEELPVLIQTEVKNGKYIEDEKELFGFLENYSS